MCGIAGLVFPAPVSIPAELVADLSRSLEHRGPDDWGYLFYGPLGAHRGRHTNGVAPAQVTLVNRRLSILDLTESGWQPMGTPDGRYYITFNGEIYNYAELRAELEALGYRFRSTSDTEVLLSAYAEWGCDALRRLVGMFAFAVLDTRARSLILARDFLGIKPLYYSFATGGFAFASETTTMLKIPGITRRVNPERLYSYLRRGQTDLGGETFFADIRQLPAGHYLTISLDEVSEIDPVRYWHVDLSAQADLSFDEAGDRFRDLFLESLNLHLRSDAPVGIALSGGLDSSSIALGIHALKGGGFQTFSYIPDDPRITEEEWIDLVARATGAAVHKVRLTRQDLVGDIDHLIEIQGEPFRDTRVYAQYRVFRLAHENGMKVIIEGQGGDELLGGYRDYLVARLLGPGSRRQIGRPVPAGLNASWFADRGVDLTDNPRVVDEDEASLRVSLWRSLTETTLPYLLRHGDRNAMAFSLENRVPFLTPNLVSFVLALPDEYIITPQGTSKALLRKAMRGVVPDAILDRQVKVPFLTPEARWLRELTPWIESTLNGVTAREIPVLKRDELVRERERRRAGQRPDDPRVWRWLNVIRWAENAQASFD